jgi:hypothetical protein
MTMFREPRAPAILILAILAGLIAASCGSSGAVATATARATSAAATAAPAATAAAATEVPSDSSGGAQESVPVTGIPTIVTANWQKATAHVDVSRDKTESFDMTGAIVGLNGIAIGTFGDPGSQQTMQMTISGLEHTGFALTTPNLLAGGSWGDECQIKITKNDASGFAGEFSCSNVDGADRAGTQALHLDIRGTFSGTP